MNITKENIDETLRRIEEKTISSNDGNDYVEMMTVIIELYKMIGIELKPWKEKTYGNITVYKM